MKLIAVGVLFLMVLAFVVYVPSSSGIIAPPPTNITKAFTSISTAVSPTLVASLSPKNVTFDPATATSTNGKGERTQYFGQDLGKFSVQTNPNSFVWSTSPNDFMLMQLPSIGSSKVASNSIVYSNSTHTALKLAVSGDTVNIFFKPFQYQIKITIQVNLAAPQQVCIPFSSSGKILQQTSIDKTTLKVTPIPSIKAGNEIFAWNDIKPIYGPSWDALQSSLCLSLPKGITNIDPLALDGSGFNNNSCQSTTCGITVTTSIAPDVIEVLVDWNIVGTCVANVVAITDSASNTYTMRFNDYGHTGAYGCIANFYTVWTGSGILSITATATIGFTLYGGIGGFGVSGASTGDCGSGGTSCFDANAYFAGIYSDSACPASGGTNQPCVTGVTTANANDFIVEFEGGLGNSVAGTGFTLIGAQGAMSVCCDLQYKIVSSTLSSETDSFGSYTGGGYRAWVDAIQQGVTVAPLSFVLKVNPANGGAIYKCLNCPDIFGAGSSTTTISSSATYTISSVTTFTLIAQEFASYIWFGWTGATTFIQDTINPTQTIAITATATTTENSTLTAQFSTPSGGGGAGMINPPETLAIFGIFLTLALAVFVLSRKRTNIG